MSLKTYASHLTFVGLAGLVLACGGSSSTSTKTSPTLAVAASTVVPTATAGPTMTPVPVITDDDVKRYLLNLVWVPTQTVPKVVRKWAQPLRVFLYGDPTPDDRATVDGVMAELKTLTGLEFFYAEAEGQENLGIYFVPRAEYKKYDATLTTTLRSTFHSLSGGARAVGTQDLSKTYIFIDSGADPAPLDAPIKRFEIRRNLIGSMGLPNRVATYPDSIFNVNPNRPLQAFSAVDKRVLQLLYSDAITPGMDEAQLRVALSLPAEPSPPPPVPTSAR